MSEKVIKSFSLSPELAQRLDEEIKNASEFAERAMTLYFKLRADSNKTLPFVIETADKKIIEVLLTPSQAADVANHIAARLMAEEQTK